MAPVSDLKSQLSSLKIDRDPPTRKVRWPWLIVVCLLIAAGGYYLKARPSLMAPEVQTVHASVQTPAEVIAGTPILTASGYVVARRQAVVSSKIQGRLSERRVEEGSVVKEGDIIARLEDQDFKAQVELSKAGVEHAQADLAENQRLLRIAEGLRREGVYSQDQLDAARSHVSLAQAALSQARATLDVAQANLANTVIRAPFSGVVVKKMAEVGESVAPIPPGVTISSASGAIVALADFSTLEVEADVAESNVSKLRDHQPAEVEVEALPDKKFRAVLRQIIPTADRTKATVMVKVTILDKDKNLKPEMSAKATFFEPEKKAANNSKQPAEPRIRIPKDALTTRAGKPVVFQVDEGKVRERAVVLGPEREGQIEVKQGLAGSETLVSHPAETLRDGESVRVKG